ncbi:unnamed protein product [Absidia cylindrospora]
MYPANSSTIDLTSHVAGEDDATTLYPESHTTLDSTLVTHSKLCRTLLARLSDSGYLSPRNEKAATPTIIDPLKKEPNNDDEENDETREDPYQWLILLGGFLAQAISMSTLSSW